MISPFAILVVLATTLTIASPVPGPSMPIPNPFLKVPAKNGLDKMADHNCIAKSDGSGDTDSSFLPKKAAQVAFDGLVLKANIDKDMKPLNRVMKAFPRRFDVGGKDTDVGKALGNGCEKVNGDSTYLQFPIGSADSAFAGGETGPDRLLALAEGKYPNYKNFTYCGVITHRGQKNNKIYHACQKKAGPKEE